SFKESEENSCPGRIGKRLKTARAAAERKGAKTESRYSAALNKGDKSGSSSAIRLIAFASPALNPGDRVAPVIRAQAPRSPRSNCRGRSNPLPRQRAFGLLVRGVSWCGWRTVFLHPTAKLAARRRSLLRMIRLR